MSSSREPRRSHLLGGRLLGRGLACAAVASVAALGLAGPAQSAPASATAAAPTPTASGTDFTLTVLHVNDGESQLLGVDGDSDDETNAYGGAARFATLWDRLWVEGQLGFPLPWPKGATGDRAEALATGKAQARKLGKNPFHNRGVLTISGGDNFLAGPEFSASLDKGVPFYDSTLVKRLHLDASAVGNHEFDFGPDTYADFIEGLDDRTPLVSANLDVSAEPKLAAYADKAVLTKSRVVKERGERIGVIGLTTPELPSLSSPRDVKVLPELAEIANAEAATFAADGVDKVLVVSHLQDIDNELDLVPELSGVDAVIGAGGGEILANEDDELIPGDEAERGYPLWAKDADGARVPVVTTTGDYKYVGRLVLDFDRDGTLLDVDDSSGPVRVSGVGGDAVPKDRYTEKKVEEPVAAHLEELKETVVATSEVGLDGVRNNVRSKETNLGNLLSDALLWVGKEKAAEYDVPEPVVGVQNGGGIRNDSVLPAGDVTALDTYDVAPFANFVSVIPEVPRDRFRQLLERGVSASPDAAGQFIQIAGAKFTYDTSKTAQVIDETSGEITTPGERIQDVTLDDGTKIVENGEVVDGAAIPVATQDFSARGGDSYPIGDLEFTSVGVPQQQALRDFLSDGLSGTVSKADYPEGGEGRITPVG